MAKTMRDALMQKVMAKPIGLDHRYLVEVDGQPCAGFSDFDAAKTYAAMHESKISAKTKKPLYVCRVVDRGPA